MIAEHTSVYGSTSSTATFPAAAVQHHPSAIAMMVHRVADTCRSWVKAPVLPYASLWEASFVVGLLAEREGRPRPDAEVAQPVSRTDAWLRG
jgi:hypothetical protein